MNVCGREFILRTSAVLVALTALAAAPVEPSPSVNIYNNTIQVNVRDDNDKPVPGYVVRLRDRDKKVIAEGKTNDEGRWEHFLPKAGKYEILWGPQERSWPVKIDYDAELKTGLSACCLTGAQSGRSLPPPAPRLLGVVFGIFLLLVGLSGLVMRVSRSNDGIAPASEESLPAARRRMQGAQLLALLLLVAGGFGVLVWSVAPTSAGSTDMAIQVPPPPTPTVGTTQIIDGNHDLKQGALADLRKRKVEPLSGALDKMLSKTDWKRDLSLPRPLLTSEAPDFELLDHHGHKRRLKDMLEKGPVVLVFYYGYFCDHCVSQLFSLQADIKYFHELGAEVVAISPDTPEITRDRFKEYGAFDFPVLSDPENKVAQEYGVFAPKQDDKEGFRLHGTFVIDREGRVQWCYDGSTPYTNNRTLLYKLAESEDKLPAKEK